MDMTMAMTSNMPMPTGAHDMHHGGHGMPAMDHGAHSMDHGSHGMGQCKISVSQFSSHAAIKPLASPAHINILDALELECHRRM